MTPLTKATQITKDRLHQWRKRNEAEGVACTPAVLVSVIYGEKSGIILNLVPEVPLESTLKVLELAVQQVAGEIQRRNNGANDGLASEAIKP